MAQLYVNIPGTASGQDDLDDVQQKCSTVLTRVDNLLLPEGANDELTKKAVEQLRKFNKSISQVLGGLLLLTKADGERIAATTKALADTNQSIEDVVTTPTTKTFKAH